MSYLNRPIFIFSCLVLFLSTNIVYAQTILDSLDNTSVQPVYKYNAKQLNQKGGVVSTLALQQGSLINSKAQLQYRGLSPRYNAVYIDGILAPSTETSTKAFSFNGLPSGFVNSVNVYTNGTAGITGEFTGAAVDIHTKAKVDKNFTTLSVNLGFLPYTTGQDFYKPQNYGGQQTSLEQA
ncbi:hypothetical protein EI427_24305 [Flammeovirga pectinis]|uniref:TonB-dependent receptor plug domain-containing protein n=1 Tax=Flammeovirga pectinis TaxID=2494373 RepID=A0A3Q9FQ38_9BACT|nr:TonB-dependent receptor plug domain-containing protein [Flammeovirga pectinis]AZQ65339.1 hypothetical protein EI427_24305 [Flammeovirga pectinis]